MCRVEVITNILLEMALESKTLAPRILLAQKIGDPYILLDSNIIVKALARLYTSCILPVR